MEQQPLHPQRDLQERPEQKSPALADQRKQDSPPPAPAALKPSSLQEYQHQQQLYEQKVHEKIGLKEINPYLTCHLCQGYLIDATTISECLHSFCRSCIIKFLEENSFCPVCEVIINKAKPNLKLDKTLQDIVYKLVPGLFLSEMLRRKRFFADRPEEAGGASPEQRGEDTERTIFNPQDRISLSLEYIGDDVTSGMILRDLRKSLERERKFEDEQTLLKRYLQCPGMCRIDVIKKFIRNKYNVNTDLFQIDILYKRVPLPLPDHYTLIDVAYIYTWKRNEPMRFYFRIVDKGNEELPDLTKVFTPIEVQPAAVFHAPQARSTPVKKAPKSTILTTPDVKERVKKRSPKKTRRENHSAPTAAVKPATCDTEGARRENVAVKTENKENDLEVPNAYKIIILNRTNNLETVTDVRRLSDRTRETVAVKIIDGIVKRNADIIDTHEKNSAPKTSSPAPKLISTPKTSPVVNTNSPTFKIEPANDSVLAPKEEPIAPKNEPERARGNESPTTSEKDMELEKAEFLKSIELTSRKTIEDLAKMIQTQKELQQKKITNAVVPKQAKTHEKKTSPKLGAAEVKPRANVIEPRIVGTTKFVVAPKKLIPNYAKRKNPSPLKNVTKKTKAEPKRTTKIIIQQKPLVQQESLLKVRQSPTAPNNKNDLHSLFQNCRLNIPSSLSITLKEDGETARKPVTIPPVQNYIEILKIDEKEGKKPLMIKQEDARNVTSNKSEENTSSTNVPVSLALAPKSSPNASMEPSTTAVSKENNNNNKDAGSQSFQKIFEESIKKSDEEEKSVERTSKTGRETPPQEPPCKKSKIDSRMDVYTFRAEMDAQTPRCPTPMPRLSHPSKASKNVPNNSQIAKNRNGLSSAAAPNNQTIANLRSSSLGLNYTVSVGKQNKDPVQQTYKINGVMTAPIGSPNGAGSGTSVSPVKKQPERVPTPRPSPVSKTFAAPSSSKSPSGRQTSTSMSPPAPSTSLSLSPNQLLEKYKIQNLAQLSASINLGAAAAAANFFGASGGQMAALQKVMMLKQFEQLQQSRQKWLNNNHGQLLQFEKYMQSLAGAGGQIVRNNNNAKDN